jgi:hypothetical protein
MYALEVTDLSKTSAVFVRRRYNSFSVNRVRRMDIGPTGGEDNRIYSRQRFYKPDRVTLKFYGKDITAMPVKIPEWDRRTFRI